MKKYTKQQAISIITDCADKYRKNLEGCQLLFMLKDKHNKISYLEVSFNAYNFLHLTGIKLTGEITASDFYRRCLNHKLRPEDFSFATDGTTQLKLEILPQLMSKNISAKMAGDYSGGNPKLYTEKLAGGVKACLGFVLTENGEYVPNTVLNVDIRDAVWTPLQVIATYRRSKNAGPYQELVYKAKNVNWEDSSFLEDYYLILETRARLEKSEKTIPFSDVLKDLGIDESEILDAENVEIV